MEIVGNNLELGNTRPVPSKYWCFTLNGYTEELYERVINNLRLYCDKFIVGKEIGNNGNHHLQGYVSFITKQRPLEKFRDWGAHWEKRRGTHAQAWDYCKKEQNYTCYPPEVVIEIIKDLRPWQAELEYKLCCEPIDPREIIWIVDPIGGCGKSAFCKYMYVKRNAAVSTLGKSADIAMLATPEKEIYLLDFSRTMADFCPYMAIENLKNGFIQDAKLKKTVNVCVMNPPHVVCFANFEPEKRSLSNDRWNIVYL